MISSHLSKTHSFPLHRQATKVGEDGFLMRCTQSQFPRRLAVGVRRVHLTAIGRGGRYNEETSILSSVRYEQE